MYETFEKEGSGMHDGHRACVLDDERHGVKSVCR